jgi:hypothetical protein
MEWLMGGGWIDDLVGWLFYDEFDSGHPLVTRNGLDTVMGA